jgi:hypothetical protein
LCDVGELRHPAWQARKRKAFLTRGAAAAAAPVGKPDEIRYQLHIFSSNMAMDAAGQPDPSLSVYTLGQRTNGASSNECHPDEANETKSDADVVAGVMEGLKKYVVAIVKAELACIHVEWREMKTQMWRMANEMHE